MSEIIPPPGFEADQSDDVAEETIGPYFVHYDPKNASSLSATGMISLPHHANSMGTVHGGVLMTFADFTLCAFGRSGSTDAHIVTVSLTTEFVRAAPIGVWLHATGEVVRRTGSLVFVQGRLYHENDAVLTYSGVGKVSTNKPFDLLHLVGYLRETTHAFSHDYSVGYCWHGFRVVCLLQVHCRKNIQA